MKFNEGMGKADLNMQNSSFTDFRIVYSLCEGEGSRVYTYCACDEEVFESPNIRTFGVLMPFYFWLLQTPFRYHIQVHLYKNSDSNQMCDVTSLVLYWAQW